MIGIDIVEIGRMRDACRSEAFMRKVYTYNEIMYIKGMNMNSNTAAGIFAAKEAISKALGTGISEGVQWHDIEISHDILGKPLATLKGISKTILDEKGSLEISISHTGDVAVAVALIISKSSSPCINEQQK